VLQDDISARVIPCTISSVDSRNDFKPTLQTGDRYKSILSDLTTYSKEWGTEFDEDGIIITK